MQPAARFLRAATRSTHNCAEEMKGEVDGTGQVEVEQNCFQQAAEEEERNRLTLPVSALDPAPFPVSNYHLSLQLPGFNLVTWLCTLADFA